MFLDVAGCTTRPTSLVAPESDPIFYGSGPYGEHDDDTSSESDGYEDYADLVADD